MNKYASLPLALTLLLSGCGGGDAFTAPRVGGTGSTSSGTSGTGSFNLAAAYDQVFAGSSFTMSGTDNRGNNYSASMRFVNRGSTTVSGRSATEVDTLLSLNNTTTNGLTSRTQYTYYQPQWTPFQIYVTTTGVTYTANTTVALPSSARVGNTGTLSSFTGTDGSRIRGSWRLSSASGSNAVITFDNKTFDSSGNLIYEEADGFTVTSGGDVISLTSVLTDSGGTVITISGSKQ